MAIERTFSIIKPDAVGKNIIGKIYSRFETNGLRIVASKMARLSDEVAGGFYAEHSERPFFPDLIEFMTSGPVMVQVLEGENAVVKNRELMGATNPQDAAEGTISLCVLRPTLCNSGSNQPLTLHTQSSNQPPSLVRTSGAHLCQMIPFLFIISRMTENF